LACVQTATFPDVFLGCTTSSPTFRARQVQTSAMAAVVMLLQAPIRDQSLLEASAVGVL
jgi:hypothetical protein